VTEPYVRHIADHETGAGDHTQCGIPIPADAQDVTLRTRPAVWCEVCTQRWSAYLAKRQRG